MCGIAAIHDPTGETTPERLERVAEALRHRGPDGEATARLGPASLVHTRLSIIDVAGGDQPFRTADGRFTAIVNGEIYNWRGIRQELEERGHAFATHSDCEVVLHGWAEWGIELLGRLNGMFGLAIWDAAERRLVVARDAFGVKPVYWWTDGRRVVAASEVRAILATGLTRAALDPVALDHFLAWRFVPAPRTLFAGIQKLAPASALIVTDDGVRVESFRVAPGAPLRDGRGSEGELADEIRTRFVDAVERQMMSDVPYGAFLSGGLDSAAIVAAMAGAAPERPPLSFTIGFPGHGAELDERSAADATARAIGSAHHDTAMEMGDFLGTIAASVRAVEEPCGTASAPAALELSRFTAQSVKVVLSGQGADEPWAGYQRHQAAALLGLVDRVPAAARRPLRAAAEALPRNERAKRAARLLGVEAGLGRVLSVFEITPPELRQQLLHSDGAAAAEERTARATELAADVGDRSLLDQALYLDTHLFLPDQLLVWGDKTSMAASLEQRVPFLDQELMAFVERIPAAVRMGPTRKRKQLYREAMSGLVPADVMGRKKHPFATPYDDWLRSSLGDEVTRRFAPGQPLAETVDPATVGRLVREHQSGRSDHKRVLYCLLELSQWHREFVEEAAA